MHKKYEVIETSEAIKAIINRLNDTDINLNLIDSSGEFNIILDNNARHLLKSYYESKLK